MNIKIYDIDWDCDIIDDVMLPTEITLHLPCGLKIIDAETEELADFLSDYLSDTFGWCHNGFKFDEV